MLSFFVLVYLRWDGMSQGLWACVYKGVEVKRVNGNAKSFLCEKRGKILKQPNENK